MKKYLLPIFITLSLHVFAQYDKHRKADSLEIENIKRQIPFLNGQAEIDSLNALSEKYSYIIEVGGFTHRADSMFAYAVTANKKATRINYKKGIVFSLVNLGRSENFRNNDKKCIEYLNQAIQLEKENPGNIPLASTALGHAYSLLGDCSYNANDFLNFEENLKKAIQCYHQDNNVSKEAQVCLDLSTYYIDRGKYEEAFDYGQKGLKLVLSNTITRNDIGLIQPSFWNMAMLYNNAGDYETSLYYLRLLQHYPIPNTTMRATNIAMGVCFRFLGNLDSSIYFIEKSYPLEVVAKVQLSYTYLLKKEYLKAMKFASEGFDEVKNRSEKYQPAFFAMGKCYLHTNKFKEALRYTKEAISLAEKFNFRPAMMEGYELISQIYHELNNNSKAYFYHTQFSTLKDSILNRQFLLRLNNYKKIAVDEMKENAIELLNKDNKIKQQQLKQEETVKNFLVALLLIILISAIFVIRNLNLKRKNEKLVREQLDQRLEMQQLESEKKHAELQQQAIELQMQALRAQMNPHFIFNCLSSVNSFIIENETETASHYLTRFSRLIRMVLNNSQKSLIPLEEELKMLELYLDMERLRFDNSFDYSITFANAVRPGSIAIPPLLLQPFCENAIRHGLMHKEEKGYLGITISVENNMLYCEITDNGIGRQRAAKLKKSLGESSLGLKMTSERLALFNENEDIDTFYQIEDVLDEYGEVAGTKVMIKIRHKTALEEII